MWLYPLSKTSEGNTELDDHYETDISKSFDISEKQFNDVLDFADENSNKEYHLDDYNCTDFALDCAKVSGNELPDTQGSWALGTGGGSNPGDLGEDIRENKGVNDDINKVIRESKIPHQNGAK